MKTFKTLLLALTLTLMSFGAQAMMVNVTMTVDNILMGGGFCDDMTCMGGIGWQELNGGPLPNASDWPNSDTVSLNLGSGTHWFAFRGVNLPGPNAGNPAGLLAEITWGSNVNSSSSAWERSLDDRATWGASTEWAQNGGGIWSGAGVISGISTNANWIWDADNFGTTTPEAVWFRTSITILPEPGTLALLLIGLAGLASLRRRA